jgi:hypothetical protein
MAGDNDGEAAELELHPPDKEHKHYAVGEDSDDEGDRQVQQAAAGVCSLHFILFCPSLCVSFDSYLFSILRQPTLWTEPSSLGISPMLLHKPF